MDKSDFDQLIDDWYLNWHDHIIFAYNKSEAFESAKNHLKKIIREKENETTT